MKSLSIIFLVVLLASCGLNSKDIKPQQIHVYIASGQSNAQPAWRDGIEQALLEIYQDTSAFKVLYSRHNGTPLRDWFDTIPQKFYIEDIERFYSELPESNYKLMGFYWFQGENDVVENTNHNQYKFNFKGMINEFEKDLNGKDIKVSIMLLGEQPISQATLGFRTMQIELAYELDGLTHDSQLYRRADRWHIRFPHDYFQSGYNQAKAPLTQE